MPTHPNRQSTPIKSTLAVVGGISLANLALNAADNPSAAERADTAVTHNLTIDKPVSILEGGTAIVTLADDKRAIIRSPIVAPDAVVERTIGDEADSDPITAYEKSDYDGVEGIEYKQDGRKLSAEQAAQAAVKARVEFTPGGELVIAENQVNAGEPVAQSVHQHKETDVTHTFVNDIRKR
jgi:hypothetical protein